MMESIDWQVESLRVTAFPENISDVSAEATWDTCIGTVPDETRIQRGGIETRESVYENGRIFLIKQVDRIDWRYHAKQEDGDERLKLPIIGSLNTELDVVVKLAKRWIDSILVLPINRLAFAAVLLYPVETAKDGYEVLHDLLPSLNLDNVKDLNYQVNRPRESNVIEGVSINRLSRWNVTRLQILAAVAATSLQFSSAADELVACRLELDINTAAEQSEAMASDLLLKVLDELIGIGLELCKRGDVI